MAAAKYNIALEQGATWRRTLTWTEPDPDNPDQRRPKDLSDTTAHLQIRDRIGGTVLVELTHNDGILIDGPAGTITIVIRGARTMAVTVKKGVYDFYVIFPDDAEGDPRRVLEGAVVNDLTVTSPV